MTHNLHDNNCDVLEDTILDVLQLTAPPADVATVQ